MSLPRWVPVALDVDAWELVFDLLRSQAQSLQKGV